MKATHTIKINGRWYKAGETIPALQSLEVTTPYEMTEEVVDLPKEVATYTKSDILQMKVAELKGLAEKEGFENAQSLNGADLKKLLVEHFGL